MEKKKKEDGNRDASGRFVEGHGRVGGKTKGQAQRTKEMVHRIFDIIEKDYYDEEKGFSQFEEDMKVIKPVERRQIMLSLQKKVLADPVKIALEDNSKVGSMRELMAAMSGYHKTKNA